MAIFVFLLSCCCVDTRIIRSVAPRSSFHLLKNSKTQREFHINNVSFELRTPNIGRGKETSSISLMLPVPLLSHISNVKRTCIVFVVNLRQPKNCREKERVGT